MRPRSRRSSAGSSSLGKRTWSVNKALRVSMEAVESGLEVAVEVEEDESEG